MTGEAVVDDVTVVEALTAIADELRGIREALEALREDENILWEAC